MAHLDERRIIIIVRGYGAGAHQREKSLVVPARTSIVGGNGHQLKQVIGKLYPFITEKEREEIETAIDKMDDSVDSLISGFKPSNQTTKEESNQDDEVAESEGSKQ